MLKKKEREETCHKERNFILIYECVGVCGFQLARWKEKGRYNEIKRKKGKLAKKKKKTIEVITLLLRVKGWIGRKSGDRWVYSRKETCKKKIFFAKILMPLTCTVNIREEKKNSQLKNNASLLHLFIWKPEVNFSTRWRMFSDFYLFRVFFFVLKS